jgi:hypothetical protein
MGVVENVRHHHQAAARLARKPGQCRIDLRGAVDGRSDQLHRQQWRKRLQRTKNPGGEVVGL